MKKITWLMTALIMIWSCQFEKKSVEDEVPQLIQGSQGPQGIPGIGVAGEDGLSLWYRFTENDNCDTSYTLFQYHEDGEESGYQDYEERESEESPEICINNGEDGSDGNGGTNGQDGYNAYIDIEIIQSSDECEHGGKRIITWIDYSGDQVRQDDEINQQVDWCTEKCPHEEVCNDVYDTVNCKDDKVYVVWIDGVSYYNVDLTFDQDVEQGTALLYGKIKKHNSNQTLLVNVTFSDIVIEDSKNHNCLSVDNSEWIQYSKIEGTIQNVDGRLKYTISRRGEPFQVGVGANVTSSSNVFGGSGWFITSGHAQCQGDFNFNICR